MKTIKVLGYWLTTGILVIAINQYFFCPQFNFLQSRPFIGKNWYNPYQALDTTHWLKANFHAHSNAWKGITNGHGTANDIDKVYNDLGYKVRCISDYHKINQVKEDSTFIAVYEHGYNSTKTHQQILGGSEVVWNDYIFPQTISNKQDILNKLNQDADFVILNHPTLLNGYLPNDVKKLLGYHAMEVISGYTQNEDIWDEALSSGKPIFIIANDGLHNIFKKEQYARWCTWIHTFSMHKDSVINSLKRGNNYGMQIGFNADEDSSKRAYRVKYLLPKLKEIEIVNDSLRVTFNQVADQIYFIGQGGENIDMRLDTHSAYLNLAKVSHYVRIKSTFGDGSIIYTNPVFRVENEAIAEMHFPPIDKIGTLINCSFGWILLISWLLFLMFKLFGFGKNSLPLLPVRFKKRSRDVM